LLEYRDFEGISEETILARSDYKKEVDERRREGELHFGQVLGRLKYHLQQEEYEKAQELIAGLQKDRQKEEQKKETEPRQTSGNKEG
ncbi:MAG: hypothetical protein OSJ52_04150, partial [Lachnospiraceae bacterium]|nr:hypothetical protein [Lachnospiraceae bacterium]